MDTSAAVPGTTEKGGTVMQATKLVVQVAQNPTFRPLTQAFTCSCYSKTCMSMPFVN
jgi:hypothetical protein